MKRTQFILLSGLGISAVALPLWYYQCQHSEREALLTEPEMLSSFLETDDIRKIGELYRKQVASENSEEALELLLSNQGAVQVTAGGLQRQITEEYRLGQTVMVDGWILSRTEARQCALFSLTHNE
ncbi:MAG: hypothetical protein R2819_10460 [Allomuricauda sp.]